MDKQTPRAPKPAPARIHPDTLDHTALALRECLALVEPLARKRPAYSALETRLAVSLSDIELALAAHHRKRRRVAAKRDALLGLPVTPDTSSLDPRDRLF